MMIRYKIFGNQTQKLNEHDRIVQFKDEIETNGANLSGREQFKLLSAFVEVVF